mgnify:CR=1 FL=1
MVWTLAVAEAVEPAEGVTAASAGDSVTSNPPGRLSLYRAMYTTVVPLFARAGVGPSSTSVGGSESTLKGAPWAASVVLPALSRALPAEIVMASVPTPVISEKVTVRVVPVPDTNTVQSWNYSVGGQYFVDGANGVRADYAREEFQHSEDSADVVSVGYVHKF